MIYSKRTSALRGDVRGGVERGDATRTVVGGTNGANVVWTNS